MQPTDVEMPQSARPLSPPEREERYHSIMVDAFDGIAVVEEGVIREANPAFARMCGVTVEECEGAPLVRFIEKKAEKQLQWCLTRCKRMSRECIREDEIPVVMATGEKRYWRATFSPLTRPPGLILLTAIDVTEQRHVQQQLVQQEKLAAAGVLAAGIAHEIGNPLSSISSLVQLLQLEVADKGVRERLRLMDTHVGRIAKIVRQLAEIARPPLSYWELVDVHATLDRALELCSYDKRLRSIEVVRDYGRDLPRTRGLADGLEQVFLNIVLNAADAMPRGGTLTVRTAQRDGTLSVAFADTGVGMTEEEQVKAFDLFYTTKPLGHGTGLGLPVSYSIVRSHGGTIAVQSQPGRGSTFEVELPIRG